MPGSLPCSKRLAATLASLACLFPLMSYAQALPPSQLLSIDSLAASKNLISMPPPVYPIHAKQLHIKGVVVVEVHVDKTGRVDGVRALSGPEELRAGAVDAFSGARYKPFLKDAQPTEAVISTRMNFEMKDKPLEPGDEQMSRRYFELHERCETLKDKDSRNALDVCLETVQLFEAVYPTSRA